MEPHIHRPFATLSISRDPNTHHNECLPQAPRFPPTGSSSHMCFSWQQIWPSSHWPLKLHPDRVEWAVTAEREAKGTAKRTFDIRYADPSTPWAGAFRCTPYTLSNVGVAAKRRSTIEVQLTLLEALCLRSSIPHAKSDFSQNQIAS